jgi:hypothetical protein
MYKGWTQWATTVEIDTENEVIHPSRRMYKAIHFFLGMIMTWGRNETVSKSGRYPKTRPSPFCSMEKPFRWTGGHAMELTLRIGKTGLAYQVFDQRFIIVKNRGYTSRGINTGQLSKNNHRVSVRRSSQLPRQSIKRFAETLPMLQQGNFFGYTLSRPNNSRSKV